VSDELSPEENKKLLNLLKKHKKVIGYSINDLKGLRLAFCTHGIPMEDQRKTVVDHQRRLLTVYFDTPNMFITLWFGFNYGTKPPLGTLMI
jgi:hypothetical protein